MFNSDHLFLYVTYWGKWDKIKFIENKLDLHLLNFKCVAWQLPRIIRL